VYETVGNAHVYTGFALLSGYLEREAFFTNFASAFQGWVLLFSVASLTVGIDTLFATVECSIRYNVETIYTYRARVGFWGWTGVTVRNGAVDLKNCDPSLDDTVLIIGSASTDVSKTIQSPFSSPRILYYPVSWSIPDK
jgi:hypothetical protein